MVVTNSKEEIERSPQLYHYLSSKQYLKIILDNRIQVPLKYPQRNQRKIPQIVL